MPGAQLAAGRVEHDPALPPAERPHLDARADLGAGGGRGAADRLDEPDRLAVRLSVVEDGARDPVAERRLELARPAAESTSPPAGRAAKPPRGLVHAQRPRRSNPVASPSAASSAWRARLASLSARIARVPAAAREAREETTNRPSHGSTAGRGRSEKGLSGFSSQRSPSRSAAGFAIGDEWLGQISPAFPAEHPAASAGPRSSSVTLAPRRASS